MNCSEFHDKALDFLYGLLPDDEARAVEEHADTCETCRAELERAKRIERTLGQWQTPTHSENLTEKVITRIRRQIEPARRRRMRILKTGLAAVACLAVFLFAVSLMNPGAPEKDVVITGSRTLVPGEENLFIPVVFETKSGKPVPPDAFTVSLENPRGELRPVPSEFLNGSAITVRPDKDLPEGQYRIVFSHPGGNVVKSVEARHPCRAFLSTDKTLYSAAETVTLRALMLDTSTNTPLAGEKINFVLRAKGRVILRTAKTTDDFGAATAVGTIPADIEKGFVVAEITGRGQTARKVLPVRDPAALENTGSTGPEGADRGALNVLCLPDGGVVMPGQKTVFHIYTAFSDGSPASCVVKVPGRELRTDEHGHALLELAVRDDFEISAAHADGNTARHTLKLDVFRSDIAVIPEKAVVDAGQDLVLNIHAAGRDARNCRLDVFRDGRMIRAVEVGLSEGKGAVSLKTVEREAGTWRLVAYLDSTSRGRGHARNVYVRPERRLSVALGSAGKRGKTLAIPVTIRNEDGTGVKARVALRIERAIDKSRPAAIDTQEAVRLNRWMFGEEFACTRDRMLGTSVLNLTTDNKEDADRILAGRESVPGYTFSGSSQRESASAFERHRMAVLGWLLTARFRLFPLLLIVLTCLILARNLLAVLRPGRGERRARLDKGWVLRQTGALLGLGGIYFVIWSILSSSSEVLHIISQAVYPLGILTLTALIVRAGAHLRQKSGVRVDAESRLVELGILMAVFIPLQFFDLRRLVFLRWTDEMSMGVNAIIFFLVITAGLAMVRAAGERRKMVLRYSPVLVAVAIFLIIGVNHLGRPQMIPPSSINLLPASTIPPVQSELMVCHTDDEGKVLVELPEWAPGARITIEVHTPDGRRGVLQKTINIPF
jgi:hypothetical protein